MTKVLTSTALLVVVAVVVAAHNGSMRKQQENGFTIVGLQTRTNNARETSGDGLIGKQWQRLYGEGALASISHRADSSVVALYTDYASDEHGDYTYILGARVNSCTEIPEGMVCRHVPPENYLLLESERGALPGIVVALWKRVWSSTPEQLGGVRSYRNDYELYAAKTTDPAHAQVELHLSVK